MEPGQEIAALDYAIRKVERELQAGVPDNRKAGLRASLQSMKEMRRLTTKKILDDIEAIKRAS